MFCHLRVRKVIAMSHPFPKDQMRHKSPKDDDASACKNIKMIRPFYIIRIVYFKINMPINSRIPNGVVA